MASKGVSLVEMMVALMILSLISGAVILMTLQVLSVANSSRMKNQSTVFAEALIEQARDYFQTNGWAALSNFGKSPPRCFTAAFGAEFQPGTTCVFDNTSPQCNIPGLKISGTGFYRYLILTTSGTSVEAQAVVTWKDRGVCRKTELDTYFYSY